MNLYDFQMDGFTVSLDTGKKFQFFAGGTAGNEKLSGGECQCGNGIVSVRYRSDLWEEHDFIIECQRDFISFRHRLKGKGTIGKLSYLCSSEYGFAGNFSDVFNTAPNFQQRRYYHPADSVRISNGNNLDPNCGGQALASPLHLFGLGSRGEKGWIAAGMFTEPGNYRWDDFWWNPVPEISPTGYELDKFLIGGFAIDYAGRESIDGEWFSPRLVFSFSDTEESILSTALETAFQNGWMKRPSERTDIPLWWKSPIYCTWHDQVAFASREQTSPRDFCTQALTEKCLEELIRHQCCPGIVILDDGWQLKPNSALPDEKKWPDMPQWIRHCHERNIRVFLWYNSWDRAGFPEEECILRDGIPVAPDVTSPAGERRLRRLIDAFLDPRHLGADGLKLDGLLGVPTGPGLSNHENLWGLELQKRYLEIVYDEAKKVNPEACISTFTPNPCLSDFCDMVRLGDMYSTRLSTISAMRERAAIYHDTLPYTLVDTDGQFEHCLGEEPAAILREQAKLGIPTLYNALLINRGHMFQPSRLVPLSDADYQSFSAYYRPPE